MGRIGSLSYNSFDSYRTSSSAPVKTQNIHKFHYQISHLDLDINANKINNAPNLVEMRMYFLLSLALKKQHYKIRTCIRLVCKEERVLKHRITGCHQ